MSARAISAAEVAEHLGIGRSSLSERMTRKRRFTLAEVADMAELFDVSPVVFFGEPADLIQRTDPRSGSSVDLVDLRELVGAAA